LISLRRLGWRGLGIFLNLLLILVNKPYVIC
jgi:hypothetical protein